jgi:hypothetical protein
MAGGLLVGRVTEGVGGGGGGCLQREKGVASEGLHRVRCMVLVNQLEYAVSKGVCGAEG